MTGDAKTPLLHSLGLDRQLPFVDVGDLYEVRGPLIGAPFALPHGMDAAYTALAARFPQHADGLRRIWSASRRFVKRCGSRDCIRTTPVGGFATRPKRSGVSGH